MRKKISYESSNGVDTIQALCWLPEDEKIRGVVQIVHGMCEYIERYEEYAEFLCSKGFIVAGENHLGHGSSAGADGYGYFAKNDGWHCLIDDAHRLTVIMQKKFPDLPYFLLGHSMGSFIARAYAIKYPGDIDGLILSGTAGTNPSLPAAIMLSATVKATRGDHFRSDFINSLAFGGANKAFEPARTPHDWLTRVDSVIDEYEADERCTFVFTASAYYDLFMLLSFVGGKQWAKKVDKDLPIFIYSGDMDPIGGFGKGILEVYENLHDAGVQSVQMKLYEMGRHEMHNETNRDEVFADVLEWLTECLANIF